MQLSREHLERYLIDALLKRDEERSSPRVAPSIFSLTEAQLALDERLAVHLLKPVAEEIKRIAQGYTNDRTITIAPLTSAACRAYALYYSLINFEKFERLLRSNLPRLAEVPRRVLDYGCGPGTAAFALVAASSESFSLTGVDSNSAMRELATMLLTPLTALKKISELKIVSPEFLSTPSQGKSAPFDLILAGHVFNEFPEGKQREQADLLLERLAPDGTLLIMESALQPQTRELMRLRDYILAKDSSMHVAFPCTHRTPCPMLKESHEWCHGSLSWNPPHLVRQIDQLTGFNKHRIKYSAFVLSRNVPAGFEHSGEYRVVAPPSSSKRGDTAKLCGADFYGDVHLPRKKRDERNIEFRRADHFDLILTQPVTTLTSELDDSVAILRRRAP